ncbi:hypothetical protein [Streptomyces sp. NPDC058084]|uniref:hypothetical protein n=1 Tax=Streptomyces sp. NPDC058084 TaxID=3346333 RepID=UPI0036EF5DDC
MTALDTARDVYPKGTPRPVCIAHNRLRKAIRIAMALYVEFGPQATPAMIERLTEADFERAARREGVNSPNSDETRDQVRLLLKVFVALGTTDGPVEAEVLTALLGGTGRHFAQPGTLVALVVPVAS